MKYPDRWRWLLVAVVFVVALCVRLYYLQELAKTPYWRALVVDEQAYHQRALAVASGDWRLGFRPYYQDPLYSYLIGGFYRVVGIRLDAVRLLQAALGAASAGLLVLTGFQLAGWVAGTVAGLLAAMAPSLLFYDGQVEKTSITVSLTSLALACGVRVSRTQGSALAWLLAGFPWGLLALLRGNFLLLLPAVVFWAWLASGRDTRRALCFTLAILLPILPFTLRNLLVAGEPVLVTSQGGQNLYLGNWSGNPSGSYVPPAFLRAHPEHEERDFAREAERVMGQRLSAREVSHFWFRAALVDIVASPARFARFALRRLGLALHPEDVPDNLDLEFLARWVPLLRAPFPDFGLLVLFGVPGLILLAVHSAPAGRLIAGMALGYLCTLLPFFVFGRYREPLFPALALGAGALVAELTRAMACRQHGRVALATLSVVAMGSLRLLLPAVEHPPGQGWNTHGTVLEAVPDLTAALAAYEAGVREAPEHPLLNYNLARVLALQGRREDAERSYRIALSSQPGFAEAHANLGALLLQTGAAREARDELEAALRFDPALAEASFNLGLIHQQQGEQEQAARRFREAAALFPTGSFQASEALRRALAIQSVSD